MAVFEKVQEIIVEELGKDAEEVKQVCIYQKEKRIAENALRLEES